MGKVTELEYLAILRRKMARIDPLCGYCRAPTVEKPIPAEWWRKRTLDHRLPRSRGGSNDQENLIIACTRCNQAKGSMTEEEFRRKRESAME